MLFISEHCVYVYSTTFLGVQDKHIKPKRAVKPYLKWKVLWATHVCLDSILTFGFRENTLI